MVSAWVFLGCVFCSLESEMLKYTNKLRGGHKMEELYNLPSLQKAADLQVLYMCRKGELTHDGPGDSGTTLADRLRRLGFGGPKMGENIAKQENDDYKEVVKLWMMSEEHRNNILGDYAYSGVATCVGRDGNRYWVQVFGKDVSNTEMARMREGGRSPGPKKCDMGDESGVGEPESRKAPYDGQSGATGEDGYIMVVKPPGYEDEMGVSDEPPRMPKRINNADNGFIGRRGGTGNRRDPGREVLGPEVHRRKENTWKVTRSPKPVPRDHDKRSKEEKDLLALGDDLIPPQDTGKEPSTASMQRSTQSASPSQGTPSSTLGVKVQTSTAPMITFVFKNPGNSTVVPALQSLIDVIKGEQGRDMPSSTTSTSSLTSYSSSAADTRQSSPSTQSVMSSSTPISTQTSKSIPSTVTVTKTAHQSTTTVYLSKYQVLTTTVSTEGRTPLQDKKKEPSGHEALEAAVLRLLGPGGGGNIAPVVSLGDKAGSSRSREDRGEGDRNESGSRETRSKDRCPGGYGPDGNCEEFRKINDSGLKSALEDLARRGRIHLHIVSDEDCEGREGCHGRKNRVDIGIPLSYKL